MGGWLIRFGDIGFLNRAVSFLDPLKNGLTAYFTAFKIESLKERFYKMIFLENLYPDEWTESVYSLEWEQLSVKYRAVIFDVDNTLVPHGAAADERAVRLFERIHRLGVRTMLVSNNGEERVKPFADKVQTEYVYKAGKPKKRGYEDAMRRMGTTAENTLFIGDQIFTDIWGANRAGIHTILTEPVAPSTDEIQIVIKRWFEKPFRRKR